MSIDAITGATDRAIDSVLPLIAVLALGMTLVACQASAPAATNPVAGALPGDPGDPGDEQAPAPRPTPTPNLPPVARLTISQPAMSVGTPTVLTYDPVCLDAHASRDPEGKALTFSFDLNGDGTFGDRGDNDLGCSGVPYRRPQNGTYTATVRVSDPSGLTDKASVTWNVQNRPPVATVAASATRLSSGAYRVVFTANASDRDGSVASVRWELRDASGATETVTGSYPGVAREYPSLPSASASWLRMTTALRAWRRTRFPEPDSGTGTLSSGRSPGSSHAANSIMPIR